MRWEWVSILLRSIKSKQLAGKVFYVACFGRHSHSFSVLRSHLTLMFFNRCTKLAKIIILCACGACIPSDPFVCVSDGRLFPFICRWCGWVQRPTSVPSKINSNEPWSFGKRQPLHCMLLITFTVNFKVSSPIQTTKKMMRQETTKIDEHKNVPIECVGRSKKKRAHIHKFQNH